MEPLTALSLAGNEIARLLKRLSSLKEALETRVLFSIRENLESQSILTSARFDSLDSQTQRIIASILEIHISTTNDISRELREATAALTVTVSQLLSRLESINQDGHHRTRHMILEKICEGKGIQSDEQQIVAGIEMLAVSDAEEQRLRRVVQGGILRSLSYPEMTHCYEDLIEAHPRTFGWAFYGPTGEQLPWSNLSDWLTTPDGVYWISGKAGSGKSTFMKHIFDSKRTKDCLRSWARGTLLIVATFFFWNSGTREQKSQIGLLRALGAKRTSRPHSRDPSQDLGVVVFENCPGNWAAASLSQSWPKQVLIDALRAHIHQNTIPLKICFLIDGA